MVLVGRTPSRFGPVARRLQSEFRKTLSLEAQRPDDESGIRNPHIVAKEHEIENLYPTLREADGALKVFQERNIKWWHSSRSDRSSKRDGYHGPTRSLVSSQVACVNFLLPLARIPGGLSAFLRCIDDDVQDVVSIIDQGGRPSQVEFEWVGWDEPLEGGRITRGANQTSIDALVVANIPTGHRAYLLEWKYCEEYLHPKNKGLGRSGDTRRSCYQHLFRQPESSFNQKISLDDFFFDPFYQIMRLHLLADRMVASGVSPFLPIDEARVVVVCPTANLDYRNVVRDTPLGQRFPEFDTVEDIVKATLIDRDSFSVVAPDEIIGQMREKAIGPDLDDWLEYHRVRYGW